MNSVDAKQVAVMRVVDGLWESREWVPVELVAEKVAYNPRKVKKVVGKLEELGFVGWVSKGEMGEPSIKLKEKGKDALAVWDLRKHGVIDDIGHVVGEGKESVVVLGMKGETKVALKFHRYYSGEFNRIKDSLAYTALKWWKQKSFGRLSKQTRPVVVERAKAQIEFRVLKKLGGKARVPRALGINRHVVAMEFLGDQLPAPLLSDFKGKWPKLAEGAVEEYGKALKAGVVHGDMSEYNVMVWKGEAWLIDWPQAVPRDFEGADKLLERDQAKLEAMAKKFS